MTAPDTKKPADSLIHVSDETHAKASELAARTGITTKKLVESLIWAELARRSGDRK